MKKWLFLFRHGETDYNKQHRFQGHLDIPLNQEGREQAKRLTQPLRWLECEEILSSDLSRAFETAQIAGSPLGLPIFKTPGLREAFLGDAQGLTSSELEAQFGETLVNRWRSPYRSDADVSYPGGETGSQVLERVLDSIQIHLKETPASRIGIATHGGVIRRVVRSLIGESAGMIPIPNGILYTLSWNPKTYELEFVPQSPFERKD